MSQFSLGEKSLAELKGVKAPLVAVVKRAIQITRQDFSVHDGIRTVEEQRRLVKQRVSQTMNSDHLRGEAVDLVPYVEGKLRWWWPQIYQVAAAMLVAARELDVKLQWGCVWDRPMNDLAKGITDLEALAKALQAEGLAYNARHAGDDFPDGPHFALWL